jgi:hypothetical protein
MKVDKLTIKEIEHYSGHNPKSTLFSEVKRKHFKILNESVGGDAPKDVLKAYIFEPGIIKSKEKLWKKYIVKLGHKWYPIESITEQMITCIGQHCNFKVANSHIAVIQDSVRFFSEHFHKSNQILVHGAEILSRHLNEHDTHLVDTIENQGNTREFFDIEDLICAIEGTYQSQKILDDFYELILFDALIGNNDRHFYNWGIIEHIKGKHNPYFSLIYDTARGLLWNISEEKIEALINSNHKKEAFIKKYTLNKSHPKVGIRAKPKCNHFEVITWLVENNKIKKELRHKVNTINELELENYLQKEFKDMLGVNRFALAIEILNLRLSNIKRILKDND